MKIAVYSPNWVGDATLALPFIHQLKEQYPHSKIVIVCKDWVESVFINNPNIDDIISLSKKDVRGIVNTIRTGMYLREQEFDCFYTLTDSFRSAFIMWLSDTAIRVGYKSQARSFLISKPIEKKSDIKYRPDKYLKLISGKEIDVEEKYIYLNQDEINWAKEKMLDKGISNPVALFPFSVSSSRTFPEDKIREWFSDMEINYALIDGTFWNSQELIDREMFKIPHPTISETIKLLGRKGINDPEILFFHLNHSNPVANTDSKERKLVENLGWQIANDGQVFTL